MMEKSNYYQFSFNSVPPFYIITFYIRTCVLLFLALIGTLYPYNRGGLLNWLVLLYALFSVFAGYTAASFHGQYAENGWVILYAISQESKRKNVKCFSFDVIFNELNCDLAVIPGKDGWSCRGPLHWTSVCCSLYPQHSCNLLQGYSWTPIWLHYCYYCFINISRRPIACIWWSDRIPI